MGAYAEDLGFRHVEAGPLVRSSYHAKRATASSGTVSEPLSEPVVASLVVR